jgi:murein DD-endopeptidase MepM/ murein hydrolase activator NlpD
VSLPHTLSVVGGITLVAFLLLFQFGSANQTAHSNKAVDSVNSQTLAVAAASRSVSSSLKSTGGGGIRLSGDVAVFPSHNPAQADLEPSEFASKDKRASIYTVREGDTLSNIADLFDVSVDTIVWANDLAEESIAPGDTLIILPVSGVRHEVTEGDTISGLARRYGVSEQKIRSYNKLEGETLAVGAILDIPGGEMPEQTEESSTPQRTKDVRVANETVTPTQTTQTGYYTHPVPGAVRTQGRHGYNAVDFGAAIGTSIVASASGRVTKSVPYGWNGGYGKFIVVEHNNGTETLYSHLSDVVVRRGQRVAQGQVIGYVGDTGRSTGPHLHFEVRGARNPF